MVTFGLRPSHPVIPGHVKNFNTLQAMLMMESGIRKEWLAKWWVKGWSSPAVAMRVVTLQSVSFRAYVLDSAILYEGSTRGGTNVDAPAPPIGKKRGRPKSTLSAGPPKGARLFKGFHEARLCMKPSTLYRRRDALLIAEGFVLRYG